MKLLDKSISPKSIDPGGASLRGTSRLSIAAECELKWALRYRLGLRARPKSHDLDKTVGSLVHLLLCYHYAERMLEPPAWFFERPLDREINRVATGQPQAIATAQECVDAYRRFYASESDRSVAVEHEIVVTLGELDPACPAALRDEIVTGRFDRIYEHGGALIADDYKTQASKGARLYAFDAQRWSVNRQALLYLYLLRIAFPAREVAGFVIRQIKQYPPFDFKRHVIPIDTQAYVALPAIVTAAVRREVELARELEMRKPRRTGIMVDACHAYNRHCEFYDLCYAESAEERDRVQRNDFEGA